MEKGYKFRIYPTKSQEVLLRKTFGCVRYVYNSYLAKRQELYRTSGQTMGYKECSKDLTQLKQELVWLKEPDSIALQSALEHLQHAYDCYFDARERGDKNWGLPSFKSKKDRQSYKTKSVNGNIKLLGNKIRLPKLGEVDCRISKEVKGRLLSATLSQAPSGKYYISLCCTGVAAQPLPKTGSAIALDLGLKEFAICSNGERYPNHRFYKNHEKKLAKLQRRHSRKQSGSRNKDKARRKVALLHEYIANCRMDYLHKLSTSLIREHDVIGIEGLRVKSMVKDRRLAKSIHDAGWGEFARMLQYKGDRYGKAVVRTDPFFASTQLCSTPGCSYKNAETKNLGIRAWTCPECGAQHDRDENAAVNTLYEGLRLLSLASSE